MVSMETLSCVDRDMSIQIVARLFLEKVTKFGTVCFNIKKVINVQSRRGQNPFPPGLNRVKFKIQAKIKWQLVTKNVFQYEIWVLRC